MKLGRSSVKIAKFLENVGKIDIFCKTGQKPLNYIRTKKTNKLGAKVKKKPRNYVKI